MRKTTFDIVTHVFIDVFHKEMSGKLLSADYLFHIEIGLNYNAFMRTRYNNIRRGTDAIIFTVSLMG